MARLTLEMVLRRYADSGLFECATCSDEGQLIALCSQLIRCVDGPACCPPMVIDFLARNAVYLAFTQHGCPPFIRLYQWCLPAQRAVLAGPLLPLLLNFSWDPIANYLAQKILESVGGAELHVLVERRLAGHLLELSKDKYGSNVVQSLVRASAANQPVRERVEAELLWSNAACLVLYTSPYGNFVLQTLVDTAGSTHTLRRLLSRLRCGGAASLYETNVTAKVTARMSWLRLHGHGTLTKPRQPVHLPSPVLLSTPSGEQSNGGNSLPGPAVEGEGAEKRTWSATAPRAAAAEVRGAGPFRHNPYSPPRFVAGDGSLGLHCRTRRPQSARSRAVRGAVKSGAVALVSI